MGDLIEYREGTARYEIRGLGSKATVLEQHAAVLLTQLDDRGLVATRVLADLAGPVADAFCDQCDQVHGALAVLIRNVAATAATCRNFPGSGSAPYPATPTLPAPDRLGVFSADPVTLLEVVRMTPSWHGQVHSAVEDVNLSGVTATVSYEREELVPGESPRLVWSAPSPVDPYSLIRLPEVDLIAPRLLTLSEAGATLALLTALEVDGADGLLLKASLTTGIPTQLQWLGQGTGFGSLTEYLVSLRETSGMPDKMHRLTIREYWLERGYERSGIDRDAWDPSKGAAHNAETIEAVYDYYADLYLEHPHLQWAGLANMIGPTFAAAFLDLDMLRDLARLIDGPDLEPPLWVPDVPDQMIPPNPLSGLANISDEDLLYYESTFLEMQQAIFEDAAMMHEAYLGGGMGAIRDLRSAGVIDDRGQRAWELIDRGHRRYDSAALAEGSALLAEREQRQTIQEHYDEMRTNRATGDAMTYAITLVGDPSIPGARTFAEYRPLEVSRTLRVPGAMVVESRFGPMVATAGGYSETTFTLTTPLPDGDVSVSEDRWNYTLDEILPNYQDMLVNDPAEARRIIASPFGPRMDEYRLINRLGEIEAALRTDWHLDVEQR